MQTDESKDTNMNMDMNTQDKPTMNMAGSNESGMNMKPQVTAPQLIAVTLLTLLILAGGVLLGALFGNFGMSARDMNNGNTSNGSNMGSTGTMSDTGSVSSIGSMSGTGNMIMPPGMITGSMSMDAMRGMSAIDPSMVTYTAPADARGDQPSTPQMDGDVKVFNLDVSVIKWNILPNTQVEAYAFNHQVPGPRITLTQGDKVRIIVKNDLPEATSVHWHGLILPNAMDGVADITQAPIEPGASFTYEFTVQQAGTFFYHSHKNADRQQALGMYGALIIEPKPENKPPEAWDKSIVVELQEWTVRNGNTFPAMPMEGLMPNFFTINGKSYPSTESVNLKVGEKLLVRFIGSSSGFIHPMHIHGGPFKIVATDGNPVPQSAQIEKDTVEVGPGERYDVIWPARVPGKWILHCHINHHITNDGVEEQGGGGLTMVLNVSP